LSPSFTSRPVVPLLRRSPRSSMVMRPRLLTLTLRQLRVTS
jgi:hypothetical protein